MENEKVFAMKTSKILPMLFAKAEKKGRTRQEVCAVISWLTGYMEGDLEAAMESDMPYGDFFRNAPHMNDARKQVAGSICGVRIQDIPDPLMRDIRILDKLVDELAKGKPLDKILRSENAEKNQS